MNQASALENIIKASAISFHRIVPFNPQKDKLVSLDFTAANEELVPGILNDITRFSQWVNNKLEYSHARYGIGGYAEHRTVYSASKVFDGHKHGEEPRRMHLGTDIWGKPNTAVIAPLEGIVHSFAFNNRFGDYGATIILSHNLQDFSFFTLYGHLSLNSIKNIQEGQRISAGEIFAEFGILAENGQWPPHLHFQIILDIGIWQGDYPGVCKFSEKEKWLANSPDPDIILQMNQFL